MSSGPQALIRLPLQWCIRQQSLVKICKFSVKNLLCIVKHLCYCYYNIDKINQIAVFSYVIDIFMKMTGNVVNPVNIINNSVHKLDVQSLKRASESDTWFCFLLFYQIRFGKALCQLCVLLIFDKLLQFDKSSLSPSTWADQRGRQGDKLAISQLIIIQE